MSAKINFISAGAGSGKTHKLTNILHAELAANRVKPAGVIATTFTRKAASELRERVRGFLLEQGEYTLANAMGQARIGTVNAVCGDLLKRFAFEAGLPTEQTVLEEEQATLLLKHAVDMVQDSVEAIELDVLRGRLSIEDWDEDFKMLVATIRANAIASSDLANIASENADELLSYFPKTKDDLSEKLVKELDRIIPLIQSSGNTTKVTAEYLELAESLRRGLRFKDARWSDWIKISKASPAAALKDLVIPIRDITELTVHHAGLQKDLRDYLTKQFDLAGRVLDVYEQIKLDRGVIDFTDQERLLLKLLDNPFVQQTLSDELDLLMVDEFQDTSPIQLALFLRLTQYAKQVYWVGDIKQAIYGFRGSDTELMESILKELESLGGRKERLDFSWRSRKPLVSLVNEIFVPAFSDSLRPEDIQLTPQRNENLEGAPFGFWLLDGNAEAQIITLGESLKQIVASGYVIFDKPTKQLRPAKLRDIAILRRSNDSVTATAQGLRSVGVPAMTDQPGLLSTPEALLTLACLRRLNDANDTIASAEIISLADCIEPEVWVNDRLTFLATGGEKRKWREAGAQPHPILERLSTLRLNMPVMAPAEAIETAIAECQLPGVVLQWNKSADVGRVRLANLDALVEMAHQYESVCSSTNHAASVSGLLLWLEEQAKGKNDSMALPAIDAVQVMTHHKAKGLEWPIVVLMDLHGEIKDGLWNSLRAKSRDPITAADPLKNRSLRLWPWPFGKQQKLPFKDEISRTEISKKFEKIATEEAKRLLYVSMTRARDLMILALPSKSPSGPWLGSLHADWLTPGKDETTITMPSNEEISLLPLPELENQVASEIDSQLWWYPNISDRDERQPHTFNPSKAESPPMKVCETRTIGKRMDVGAKVDWTDVGHAVHAAMALAFVDVKASLQVDKVSEILASYDLSAHVSDKALTEQINHVVQWVSTSWPDAQTLPEWPVQAVLASDQILNGRVDLLVDAGTHWILIDHKSNPGAQSSWPDLANKYGGQLLAYKNAMELATNKPVREIWLVMPVSGGAIRIEQADCD